MPHLLAVISRKSEASPWQEKTLPAEKGQGYEMGTNPVIQLFLRHGFGFRAFHLLCGPGGLPRGHRWATARFGLFSLHGRTTRGLALLGAFPSLLWTRTRLGFAFLPAGLNREGESDQHH